MRKLWYAITDKMNDDVDWGTGSFDLEVAKEKLRMQGRGEIAVIDVTNSSEELCIEEIPFEEL